MSKKHSLAGQPEARAVVLENARLDKGLEFRTVPLPDVNAVLGSNRVQIDTIGQPQPGKQQIAEALVRRQAANVDSHRLAPHHPEDIVVSRGDILPSGTVPGRMRAAAEPQPLAVGPILQIVPRPATRTGHV